MKNLSNAHHGNSNGFSLIELLAVMTIIGYILMLSGTLYPVKSVASDATCRQNAANLASMCEVIQSVGEDPVAGATVPEVVRKLRQGVSIDRGSFKGRRFGINGVRDQDVEATQYYLRIMNGKLVYDSQIPSPKN